MQKRVIILLLDSFGIGASEDAQNFDDLGANTLGNIAKACFNNLANSKERNGTLKLPNLESLGLGLSALKATNELPLGFNPNPNLRGAYAYAQELSSAKDTISGHWEMMGVPVLFEWGYFENQTNSFPQDLLDEIIRKTKIKGYLGNCHASGTEIIKNLGEKHLETLYPIFYTSADSVFQIAAHEEKFGLDNLYALCEEVFKILEPLKIARVIARPFLGNHKDNFKRTPNRKDYAIKPHAPLLFEKFIEEKNGVVISIGKIADIYAHVGITQKFKASSLMELFDVTLEQVKNAQNNSLIFTNFVHFDSDYGHRRDVSGYANALECFDKRLNEILENLRDDDLLILCADHGCDPTFKGTDHTREFIPILMYHKDLKPAFLGKSETFADIGQSIAHFLGLSPLDYGKNLLNF
ncbi:phosphopentomutase [Helicobacter cetorum]|uniref:phosphopentomutase n=1 Tax=Helicobacter cetorum TaxID=138563 RepID=UPI000CF085BF|nr:phosphopentomutase [Helicobacter cetorum]